MTMELIITFAILVESITNIVKSIYKKGEGIQIPVIVSLLVAVLLTTAYNIDMISLLGFNSTIPYLGALLTGVIFSRGANIVSDLVFKLQSSNE